MNHVFENIAQPDAAADDGTAPSVAQSRQGLAMLRALPIAVYATDLDGCITFYNAAVAALWGVRPQIGMAEHRGFQGLFWPNGTPLSPDDYPTALALKERRPIDGLEVIGERHDGTRVPLAVYPAPLLDENGALVGALSTLVDLSARKRSDDSVLRLASAVESSVDAIATKDRNGIITSWNRSAQRLFGYRADEVIGQPVTILIPDDRLDEETHILGRILRGERVEHFETVRRRKDGSLVDVSLTISPIRDGKGEVIGASKIARDITEQKQAENQRVLLLREMNHRVKNLFTLASSIASLSARSKNATPEDVVQALQERLRALSRAHELTLPDLSEGVDSAETTTTLHALVQTILLPFAGDERARMEIDGPDVPISGSAVTSVALLLHEFATNATKYGALSSPTGHVRIVWTVSGDELALTWSEQGGPSLGGAPKGEGFGSMLLRGTTAQLGADIKREWRPEGLVIHLSAPLERLALRHHR